MKLNCRILFAAGILFFSFDNVNAQFQKGTLLLGTTIGTTGYSNANADYGYDLGSAKAISTDTYTFSVGPQIGVFLNARTVLGGNLSVNYSHGNSTTSNTSATDVVTDSKATTNTLTFSVGPFLRYYFSNLASKNWFYGQITGAAGTGTGNSTGNGSTTTTSYTSSGKTNGIFNWNAGASVGMTHFFAKRIGMDFALGYTYNHQKSTSDNSTYTTNHSSDLVTSTTNNYGLTTITNGVTASVGFHFFL